MKNIGDLGGIGVARESQATILKHKLSSADVALTEHWKLLRRPRVVRPTISTVELLRKLWRDINVHGYELREAKRSKENDEDEERVTRLEGLVGGHLYRP